MPFGRLAEFCQPHYRLQLANSISPSDVQEGESSLDCHFLLLKVKIPHYQTKAGTPTTRDLLPDFIGRLELPVLELVPVVFKSAQCLRIGELLGDDDSEDGESGGEEAEDKDGNEDEELKVKNHTAPGPERQAAAKRSPSAP
ncbi:hypothetical protein K438DRAFT_1763058 [Mycena galopus ATCC 62051]|nr:hypothetical protein K438DRAFT_1763058 [Mycena galopus ATCC 62051]